MKFRLGSKSGQEVPPLQQSLLDIQAVLAQQQQQWAEQLARDPAAFVQLEPQIHRAFQQFLAGSPVVLIYPEQLAGKVIWPEGSPA